MNFKTGSRYPVPSTNSYMTKLWKKCIITYTDMAHCSTETCTFQLWSYLGVANKWKILSKRMTLKAIVGENTSQVWMISEVHAIHIPHL